MQPMLKRAAATQACMDRFSWKPVQPGVRDCGKLTAHALHKQGRRATLLTGSRHRTWAGALKYIRAKGFKDLVDLMDAVLPDARIAPAMAWQGDIIAMATDNANGFGCSLAVALDGGRVLGLNPATGLIEPMVPHLFVAAWRV